MLIVMNVVQVDEDRRQAFERAFLGRESHVHEAAGFAGFELLRRDRDGEYIVLTRWKDEGAFRACADSDAFKRSHRHADGELAHGNEVRWYEVIDARVPA